MLTEGLGSALKTYVRGRLLLGHPQPRMADSGWSEVALESETG